MRVQHDALRSDRLTASADADEEAVEVVFPGFLDLGSRDEHVVEEQFFSATSVVRSNPSDAALTVRSRNRFLERHEDAGFAVLSGAPNQELEAEHRLAEPAPPLTGWGAPAAARLP